MGEHKRRMVAVPGVSALLPGPQGGGATSLENNGEGTCRTCPSWFAQGETQNAVGLCRYDPPKIFIVPVIVPGSVATKGQPQHGVSAQTLFPQTEAGCWCSAHPDREAPELADGEEVL